MNIRLSAAFGFLMAILAVATPVLAAGNGNSWPFAGGDLLNTRYQDQEHKIGVGNAATLTPSWVFTTGGDVSATPAVDNKNVYVPDWGNAPGSVGGNLWAIDEKSGTAVWSHKISDYTGIAADFARTTPALSGNNLIFGDQGGHVLLTSYFHLNPAPAVPGAWVMAVSAKTGALVWKTQVESHPAAIVTQSAVVDGNIVYVGVSSMEEALAAVVPNYTLSFRGSIVALDATTGQILWKTNTVPTGYTGGAVWGSTPVVDHKRNSLYITSGNNYSAPQTVLDCVAAAGTDTNAVRACISPADNFDSVLSLNLNTGSLNWASRPGIAADAWNVGCALYLLGGSGQNALCPSTAGPDADFGQGATLFTVGSGKSARDLLGAGEKNGLYMALDPNTGSVVWQTQTGPGGTGGGLEWGSAVDGTRIYVANANTEHKSWTPLNGTPTTGGGWTALDPATGKIIWQVADPTGAGDPGAVTVANGVVYAGSLNGNAAGNSMYALNAANGTILWSFVSGGSVNSGAAIVKGTIYWGSGYGNFGTGVSNNKLYAFQTP